MEAVTIKAVAVKIHNLKKMSFKMSEFFSLSPFSRSLYKTYCILTATILLASVSWASTLQPMALSAQVLQSKQMPFNSHSGPFTLAMNVPYQPVAQLRHQLSQALQFQLAIFKGWNEHGEAHVTVITPPEYIEVLSPYVSDARINEIAAQNAIQNSDLQILGLGVGQATIDQRLESTYFLVVSSRNLLSIREKIYQEYVRNGGPRAGWDPLHFYPHITIGFTLRDLHEKDGVIKDLTHSLDRRFQLFWTN